MKRRSAIDAAQLGFTFAPPAPARRSADLAGLTRKVAALSALALKDDPRSREEIAAAMSAILGEDVSKAMLDAYASEARDQHNISAARFLALVAVTTRHDLLDHAVRHIGAAVLVGEELRTARLGHLVARKKEIEQEMRQLQAHPIARGGE